MNAWASDLISLAVQHIGKTGVDMSVRVGECKAEVEAKGVEGAFRLIIKRTLNWKPKQLFPILSQRTRRIFFICSIYADSL